MIAARAQGRPTIVIAIIRDAISHPRAIQAPPNTIQRIFSNKLVRGMARPDEVQSAEMVSLAPARKASSAGGFVGPGCNTPR